MTDEPLSYDDYEPSVEELDHADEAYDALLQDEAIYAVRRAWWRELHQGVGPELSADVERAAVDELLESGGDLESDVGANGLPELWAVWNTEPLQVLARVCIRTSSTANRGEPADHDGYWLTPIEVLFFKALRETGLTFGVQPWIQGTDHRYRLDFLILYDGGAVAVELDGHDSHKTKEQRAHDATRDRWFAKRKVQTIRFTGSEVFADPEGCISELRDILRSSHARP